MDSVRIAPMLQQRAGTYVWYTQQEEEQQEEQLEIQQQREEHLLPRVVNNIRVLRSSFLL